MKEMIEFVVTTSLSLVTIVVLIFTWRAALKQAMAAEKLTEATDQQIQTGAEQAAAARDQVNVAKRQITESLRPLIIIRHTGPIPPGLKIDLMLKNEHGSNG